jgi:hypothetical protein
LMKIILDLTSNMKLLRMGKLLLKTRNRVLWYYFDGFANARNEWIWSIAYFVNEAAHENAQRHWQLSLSR